jgi:hypothetical protein
MKKTPKPTVQFQGKTLVVNKLEYPNKRIAIEFAYKNGTEYTVATVNLPDEQIEDDEVILKNYSEGEGAMEALIESGVIGQPLRYAQNNRMFPICKIN